MYQHSLRQWAHLHQQGVALAVRLGHPQDHNAQSDVHNVGQAQGLEGTEGEP